MGDTVINQNNILDDTIENNNHHNTSDPIIVTSPDGSHLLQLDHEIADISTDTITEHLHNDTHKSSTIHPDFIYNKHNESIFDDERIFPSLQSSSDNSNQDIVKFDEKNPDLINNATLRALIVQLTSPEVIDYNLICDFFLTYRIFVNSEKVMNLLLTRLIWSLQYINSKDESNIKVGKLVLLRTFVVIRHWIINYFIDDFDSYSGICDLFSSTINDITNKSNLIRKNNNNDNSQQQEEEQTNDTDDIDDPNFMMFEKKILTDLKIHWLNQLNEFWQLNIDIEILIQNKSILNYILPLTNEISNFKKLSKSTTDMSIHTNPSYRRSAMLSLYDHQKVNHKMIIYDHNNVDYMPKDENYPQYSINNLLLQHQSSRISINTKLHDFQNQSTRSPIPFNSNTNSNLNLNAIVNNANKNQFKRPPHNHLNLNDSSIALKKTTVKSGNELENLMENHQSNATPKTQNEDDNEQDVILYVSSPASSSENSGFSTNGNIKLPTSKVTQILPPTPVKRMEYFLKVDYTQSSNSLNNASPTKRRKSSSISGQFARPQTAYLDDNEEFIGRKNSIKKLVDGFKKSIYNTKSNSSIQSSQDPNNTEQLNRMLNNAINVISDPNEKSKNVEVDSEIGTRTDILSARIIDELEFLIRYYFQSDSQTDTIIEDERTTNYYHDTQNERTSNRMDKFVDVDLDDLDLQEESPAKRLRVSKNDVIDLDDKALDDEDDNNNNSDMDINDLSELNIVKIDNLINVNDAKSIKQSNEKLVSTDNLLNNMSHESSFQRPISINWNDEGELNLDHSEDPEIFEDSVSHQEDDEDDDEYLMQPKDSEFVFQKSIPSKIKTDHSFDSSVSTPSNMTQYGEDIADLGIALSPQSMKQNVRRISFNDSIRSSHHRKRMSNSNGSMFKRDSVKSYLSYDSAFSISNGSRGSYKNHNDGFDFGLKKKTGFNNLRPSENTNNNSEEEEEIQHARTSSSGKSLDLPVRIKSTSSSFPSRSSSLHRSVRFSTLCALTELPFNECQRNSQFTNEQRYSLNKRNSTASGEGGNDSSIFSVAVKSRKNSVKTTNHDSYSSSTNSVAIPGISNYVLKELAAIPDESFQSTNPVDFALFKLEGKPSSDAVISSKDKANINNDGNTQDILNEINNAHTIDVIEYTQVDVTMEAPLTPVKKSSPVSNPSTSTPNNDNLFVLSHSNLNSRATSPGIKSPKRILENYTISSEALSIENVINSNSHISLVLSYDSQSLAEHFTVIEKDMLQEIDWKELIELKWNKNLTPVNSWLEIIVNDNFYNKNKGVNLVIARFNLMVNWIISEILLTTRQSERITIISRFIHIAQNCYTLQNYSSMMQIILALTSEKVQKLKETWKSLSPGDILILKNLEDLSSPLKNFLNVRLSINQMKPSKGCIPFVGLYLSDLIFNAERPTLIKRRIPLKEVSPPDNGESKAAVDISNSTMGSENEDNVLINFSKFRTAVHIVKSLSQCIEWSSCYKLNIDSELLSKCLYIKSLDEEEMNYCLQALDELPH
ncbi:hypothetical protein DFJ63DRAFT_302877 [Scheffersomyces coipomensis]|uniref:uncharacterized protein n=1 Tax=Scheffersomyces coipomensis TaxID=1788519 RepID=UPI00315C4F78